MRKDILLWKIKNSNLCNWFTKVVHLKLVILLLVVAIASSSILFCHNVSAVNLTQNVSYLGSLFANTYNYSNLGSCSVTNSGSQGYVTNTSSTSCSVWSRLNIITSSGFNNQYVIGITTFVYELRDREPLNSYNNETPTLELYSDNSYQTSLSYIGTSIENLSESSAAVTQYFKFNTTGNITANTSNFRLYNRIGLQVNEYMMVGTKIEVLALESYNITVNTNNQDIIDAIESLHDSNDDWHETLNTNLQLILQEIRTNASSSSQQQQQDQQDRDNLESQQTEVNSSAESAGDSIDSATSGLQANISSIIGAFSVAPSSDCLINVNTGNLNLNQINLCDVPSEVLNLIHTVTALIVTVAVIFISYSLISAVLALFNEFFGGGFHDYTGGA